MQRWHALAIVAFIFIAGCAGTRTESKMIDVGGHSLNFVVTEGSGQTVILEAGQGADSTMWAAVQEMLANTTNYRVISYDRAGFGKSEPDPGNYSVAREVSALEAALQKLGGADSVIYVAHSYGAFLAQEYSARNPGKVKALVLVDPNNVCFNDNGGLAAVWAPPPYNVSEANQRILYAYPGTIAEMRTAPAYPSVPTIVITSGKPPVPSGNMSSLWCECHQKLVDGNPQGELWLAENNTHFIAQENPSLVVAAIKNFS